VPRYYFHTEDGRLTPDRMGVELPDIDAARREAVQALGEILKERAEAFWSERALRICVADKDGLTLFLIDVTAVDAPAVR
jgi:hypothetical protein